MRSGTGVCAALLRKNEVTTRGSRDGCGLQGEPCVGAFVAVDSCVQTQTPLEQPAASTFAARGRHANTVMSFSPPFDSAVDAPPADGQNLKKHAELLILPSSSEQALSEFDRRTGIK